MQGSEVQGVAGVKQIRAFREAAKGDDEATEVLKGALKESPALRRQQVSGYR